MPGEAKPAVISAMPLRLQVYLVGLLLLGALVWWFALPAMPWGQWPLLLVLGFLVAVAYAFPVAGPRGVILSPATGLALVLASVFGPGPGFVVGVSAATVGSAYARGWVPWAIVANATQIGLSIAAAGVAFVATGGDPAGADLVRSLVIPLYVADVARRAINDLLVGMYFSQRDGTALLRDWLTEVAHAPLRSLLDVPQAIVLTILFARVHPALILLWLVMLPIDRRTGAFSMTRHEAYAQAVDALLRALDRSLPHQEGHSRRVADLAVALGRELRVGPAMLEAIEYAGLMHDVGLIGLDEEAPSATAPEVDRRQHVRGHSRIGAAVASELPRRDVAAIVLHHHERFDGGRFPFGPRGRTIPLGARILAVAEAAESLRDGAPHNPATPTYEDMVKTIAAEAGKAYDPRVVAAFTRIMAAQLQLPQETMGP